MVTAGLSASAPLAAPCTAPAALLCARSTVAALLPPMMAPWTSRLIFFQRAPFSGCFWSPCWSLGCSERKFCLQQADGPLSMGNALEQRNHGISPTGESTDPRTVSSHELHVQLLGKSRGGLPSFADLTRGPRAPRPTAHGRTRRGTESRPRRCASDAAPRPQGAAAAGGKRINIYLITAELSKMKRIQWP